MGSASGIPRKGSPHTPGELAVRHVRAVRDKHRATGRRRCLYCASARTECHPDIEAVVNTIRFVILSIMSIPTVSRAEISHILIESSHR
jgi:hypothetical protein